MIKVKTYKDEKGRRVYEKFTGRGSIKLIIKGEKLTPTEKMARAALYKNGTHGKN